MDNYVFDRLVVFMRLVHRLLRLKLRHLNELVDAERLIDYEVLREPNHNPSFDVERKKIFTTLKTAAGLISTNGYLDNQGKRTKLDGRYDIAIGEARGLIERIKAGEDGGSDVRAAAKAAAPSRPNQEELRARLIEKREARGPPPERPAKKKAKETIQGIPPVPVVQCLNADEDSTFVQYRFDDDTSASTQAILHILDSNKDGAMIAFRHSDANDDRECILELSRKIINKFRRGDEDKDEGDDVSAMTGATVENDFVDFILSSYGGNAHEAFKIVSCSKSANGFVIMTADPKFWEGAEIYNEFRWGKMLNCLQRYARKKNMPIAKVPISAKFEGKQIGKWVSTQRQQYHKKNLSQERIARLEEIGFAWKGEHGHKEACQEIWEELLDSLQRYARQKNMPIAKVMYEDEFEGKKIGHWVDAQRRAYRKGNLSQERIARLEEVGFAWKGEQGRSPGQVREDEEEAWEKWLNCLQRYARQKNMPIAKVPLSAKFEGKKIGNWVGTQRTQYRKGILSQERIDRLEEVGFAWERERGQEEDNEAWEKWLNCLQRYARQKNIPIAKVTCRAKFEGKQIGNWVNTQRKQYRKGILSQERIARLEEIGFAWEGEHGRKETCQEIWEEWLDCLQRYARQKNVPIAKVMYQAKFEGKQIGHWVNTQRMQYRKGILSQERIARLEEIGHGRDKLGQNFKIETNYNMYRHGCRRKWNSDLAQSSSGVDCNVGALLR